MAEMFKQVAEIPEPIVFTPKSTRNPYDRSTVVSIFPRAIDRETKYTIQPGVFSLAAGSFDKPATLVIGSSSWWTFPNNQPPIEVYCTSPEVAQSIVHDWCIGMLECDMDTKIPGLFFIPGKEVTPEEVKKSYSIKLAEAAEKQKNWYTSLINHADSAWANSNGNPTVIWDIMRIAARELNLLDKPWLANQVSISKVKCFACGNLKDPEYPICPNCRTIDPSHPRAKDIKTAG